MKTVLFLLEELSARRLLESLLPRLLPPEVLVEYVVFEGKSDLEKQLVKRLRGWQRPDTRFFVMRDQDSGDCKVIKTQLIEKCKEAGRADAAVRVACRELEAWYIGDFAAVARAYNKPELATAGTKVKFRNPDGLGSPSRELRMLLPEFQKTDGAARLGTELDIEGQNTSRSFHHFLSKVRALAG